MKNKHHELRNNITGSNCAFARCSNFTSPTISFPGYRCKKMPAQKKYLIQVWFSYLAIHLICFGSSKETHLLKNMKNYTTGDSILLIKEL